MRVLITGANGYIGQHLTLALLRDKLQVCAFSRSLLPSRISNILGLEWFVGDILDAGSLTRACDRCEVVVHLATLPLNNNFLDPVNDYRVNVAGTLNVLSAAYKAGVQRVIYTSTA